MEESSVSTKERLDDIEEFLTGNHLYAVKEGSFMTPQSSTYDEQNAMFMDTSLYGPSSNPWDSPSGSQWNCSPVRQCIPNYSYASCTPRRLGTPGFQGLPSVSLQRSQYSAVQQTLPITRSVHNQTTKGHVETKDSPISNKTTSMLFSAKFLTDVKKASSS